MSCGGEQTRPSVVLWSQHQSLVPTVLLCMCQAGCAWTGGVTSDWRHRNHHSDNLPAPSPALSMWRGLTLLLCTPTMAPRHHPDFQTCQQPSHLRSNHRAG